ncbi:MAG: hypothetical protein L3J46_02645 [Kangiellaceae bacterium]|nr:hypothetical protein [Kangiellaceae bacterium]
MTIFLTIFSGVFVFVLGQIILKLLIDPVQGYKTTVGDISIALINHANVYSNPGISKQERMDFASEELRLLASKLSANVVLIPYYEKTGKFFKLPSIKDKHEVKKQLIDLSNGIHDKRNSEATISLGEYNGRRAEKICDLLGIYVPDDEKAYRDNDDA